MSVSTFIIVCVDTESPLKKISMIDAKHVFQMTLAKARSENQGTFSGGLRYDKEINYNIFRNVLLLEASARKKVDVNGIVNVLLRAMKSTNFKTLIEDTSTSSTSRSN